MVLSGAMTGPMEYDLQAIYSRDQLRELKEQGYLSMNDETGRTRRVDGSIFQEFAHINQQELCGSVSCPVLIIHGNDPTDREEQLLVAQSRKALPLLPHGSKLEMVEGANHSLVKHFDRVIALANDWYTKYL